MRRGSARCGFLLVEALATLAISAMILAGLASVVALVLRAGDRTAAGAEQLETSGRAFDAMVREIGLATRARWAGANRRAFVFQGGPDRILFSRIRRAAGEPGSAIVVTIQAAPGAGSGRILRAEAPLLPGMNSPDELVFLPAQQLGDRGAEVAFTYVAPADGEAGEVALPFWSVPTALPSAVLVTLLQQPGGRVVSRLRVPLPLDAEPGCAAPEGAFCSRGEPKAAAAPSPALVPASGPGGPGAQASGVR